MVDHARLSRIAVSPTMPELECDIDAQIKALLDDDHPKETIFLARGNEIGRRRLPNWVFVERRPEGTLITRNAAAATFFRLASHITDQEIAAILGYPEAKADVIDGGDCVIVQALDSQGAVIFEFAVSRRLMELGIHVAAKQVPAGGIVHLTSPQEVLKRRFSRKMN